MEEDLNIVDVGFGIMDVDGQIRYVASALAAICRQGASWMEYLLPLEELPSLISATLIKLMQAHLKRLPKLLALQTASAQQPQMNVSLPWSAGKQPLPASE